MAKGAAAERPITTQELNSEIVAAALRLPDSQVCRSSMMIFTDNHVQLQSWTKCLRHSKLFVMTKFRNIVANSETPAPYLLHYSIMLIGFPEFPNSKGIAV